MSIHVPVLVVGRQPSNRAATVAALKERGYEVLEAGTADEAVRIITGTANLRVVVTDLELDGHHTAKFIHQQVGEVFEQRGGLFLITATEIPKTLPRSLVPRYFQDREIPIFCGHEWEAMALPMLAEHRAQLAG